MAGERAAARSLLFFRLSPNLALIDHSLREALTCPKPGQQTLGTRTNSLPTLVEGAGAVQCSARAIATTTRHGELFVRRRDHWYNTKEGLSPVPYRAQALAAEEPSLDSQLLGTLIAGWSFHVTTSQLHVDAFGVKVGVHMCGSSLVAVPAELRAAESNQRVDVAVAIYPHRACVHALDHAESRGQAL
ncbi:hypothetical protein SAMN02799638_01903 [Arthrobacter sp. UNCCL28]|nr:hypothetical protein SAMN02799638_01903 [Arthrobacter sp. UNCCL28]